MPGQCNIHGKYSGDYCPKCHAIAEREEREREREDQKRRIEADIAHANSMAELSRTDPETYAAFRKIEDDFEKQAKMEDRLTTIGGAIVGIGIVGGIIAFVIWFFFGG